jgi:hypothetical protein
MQSNNIKRYIAQGDLLYNEILLDCLVKDEVGEWMIGIASDL